MGIAATVSMVCCGIAVLLRRNWSTEARKAMTSPGSLEMYRRGTAVMWAGVLLGAILTTLSYFRPDLADQFLGLDAVGLRKLGETMGFGVIGVANLLDGLRIRELTIRSR